MDNLRMKGEIEVRLEDLNGRIKQREVVRNTITDAYLKYALHQLMTTTNLVAATRATASGSMASAGAVNSFGIYVMSEPITVTADTYLPPYVDDARTGLSPTVSFYNVAGATTESSQVMIPVDTRCYYNRSKMEYTLEYVKNTYAGVVKSIAIGRAHTTANNNFLLQQKDNDMPADLYSALANYALEHTAANGTVIRKTIGTSNEVITANLKTKLYSREVNANAFTNITSLFGGLAMNGHLFNVAKKTATGGTYTVTLSYRKNYLTEANSTVSLDIAVPARENMTTDATVIPVLVTRANQSKLEIFVTVSIGNHSGTIGANVKKVVVDVADIDNISYEISDMGVIRYAVSGFGTTVGQYLTGLFHDGKYYLPYYYVVGSDGTLSGASATAFQEGIVISSNFETIHNVINYRAVTNQAYLPVITDEIIQIMANVTTPYVVKIGQLVSGANLENAITKSENDVLRVIYRYKIQ
jgi:hypothetical protein